ncbi:MAG: ADP-ribosylation factor-like protein [Candidatus Helarchaeota archaeon]
MAASNPLFKIVFAGLDNSGKTSILYVLEDKFSMLNPTPTIGVERETFNVLGFPIICWDLGGQDKYRKTYIQNERAFSDTDLLFFILDIQDRSRLGDAADYFEQILEQFKDLDQFPPIIICLHKLDPDIRQDDRIQSNVQVARQVFKRKARGFDVQMFETTIYEKWTLTFAFSNGLQKLSPKSQILDQQLEAFAAQFQSDTVLLLDDNALLFGHCSKNADSYNICQIISPHLATMADKIIKYGTTFEIFQVKVGGWVFFRDVQIEQKRFYLVIYNDQAESIQEIDNYLPQLAKQITNLIQSFFL